MATCNAIADTDFTKEAPLIDVPALCIAGEEDGSTPPDLVRSLADLIPNARFDQYHVYTNNVPGGYMRGPGEAQGSFAIESHMDEVAHRLGLDPLEFRMKNILRDGQRTPMDELFHEVRAEETLQAAVKRSGYLTPLPPSTGRGIAMCARPAGGGETYAEVVVREDASIVVRTPIFEPGTDADLGFYDIRAFISDTDNVTAEIFVTFILFYVSAHVKMDPKGFEPLTSAV